MHLKKTFILAAFIAVLLPSLGFPASPKHKILFEKAKFTMETKGDLEGAIKLFNEIIEKYPDEREYAAKSQLYIGLCYEKLGLKEAQKAYRKVIDNYPGQQEEVAVAKERLARLTRALEEVTHKPTFRNIRIPTKPGNGALSPDGKKLAFASKGSIWVVPVHGKVSPDIAGEPVRLTESMGASNMGSTLSWSADGKWIAFNAKDKKKDAIYVIPSSGGKPKKIPVNLYRGGHPYNYRLSLSPDGKIVAFASKEDVETGKGEKLHIYTIPVEGGEAKRLTDAMTTEPAFSPDGKKITYVKKYRSKEDKSRGEVWVIPAAGGTPVLVSDLQNRARGPLWSPDGKMIAFNHEPEGDNSSKEIWIVTVSEEGKPTVAPTKIELPLLTFEMLAGWTSDNKVGLHLSNRQHLAIYTVPSAGGKAVQVTPAGWVAHPRWSPDGERIYFRWNGIASVPSEGGEISKGPLDEDSKVEVASPGGGNAVSPDGEKIVFSGYKTVFRDNKKVYEVDIYTIPVEGGEPKRLTISPGQDRFPCWSPDGEKIAFIRYNEPQKEKNNYIMNICIVRTEGGEVRQLTSESDKVAWSTIAWSPDGKSIAYFSDEDKAIRVIPVKGGESKEVVKVEDVSRHSELAWSRDGKKIAYSSKGRIWVVSLDGGEPEEIKTGLDAKATHISLSPDGEKIAFTAMVGGDTELYLMEYFLPEEKEDKAFNIRQVWAGPDVDILGAPSPDGRYLSYVDWETGDLAIYEIATGKKRRLTNKGSWDESVEYAIFSRWSPDGKQIVYQWYNDNNEFIDLYIIGLDGSKPRILYSNEDGEYAETYDWSPDGRQILACFYRKDGTNQMVLFSAADGSVRVLKILEQGDPVNMSFSPDGRYIVYDFRQKEGSPERDISLLSTDGSREISLIEHPANDYVLGWAPDGKNILFASDRTGILDGWVIQVADGKPQGVPELVKPNMIVRRFVTMGFTRDGSFYYGCQGGRIRDVYIAKLDPETGEILGPPKKAIKRFEGYNQSPDYSPDGKYLAYISTRGTFGGILNRPRALCIRSLETGEEREFFPKIGRIDKPRWSPDCSSILVEGRDNNNRWRIYKIDAQTGTVTPVVLSVAEEYETIYSGEWSHDGKAIFYVRINNTNNLRQILVRNLESGTEKELYRTSDDDRFNLSCSPDGKWLAFIKRGDDKGVLRIMPAAGGEPRELYRCEQEEEGNFVTLRCTPDGKYILFVISPEYSLWRIPIEGGKPEKLGLDIVNLSVHPDGQHIAFYNSTSRLAEVWVMENFMPE